MNYFLASILGIGVIVCLLQMSMIYGEEDVAKKEVVLRGSVICVDQSGSEVPCDRDYPLFALKLDDGSQFNFLAEDPTSRMFEDERLRNRELQVRAWTGEGNRLEIIKVHSVKDNQLFDVHYFCAICNIKAFVGGLCWCCQDEFEFREVPVSGLSGSD